MAEPAVGAQEEPAQEPGPAPDREPSRAVAVVGANLANSVSADSKTPSVWVERQWFAMGTRLTARVGADSRAAAVSAAEDAFVEISRLEAVLSSWSSSSDLGRLNHAPADEWVPLPTELTDMLAQVSDWSAITEGAFDPAIGPLMDAWAVRSGGRVPSEEELSRALWSSGWGRFEIRSGSGRRTDERAWIDAGGFGKGAALDAARRALNKAEIRGAWLDFGGQLLLTGEEIPASEEGVGTGEGAGTGTGVDAGVAVADPRQRSRQVARLQVRAGSVATTSASERKFEVGNVKFGHVLDPRSGRPVPAWGSVTVASAEALTADVLATALFVMGPVAGFEWAEAHDVKALFLIIQEEVIVPRWTSGLEGQVLFTHPVGIRSGTGQS